MYCWYLYSTAVALCWLLWLFEQRDRLPLSARDWAIRMRGARVASRRCGAFVWAGYSHECTVVSIAASEVICRVQYFRMYSTSSPPSRRWQCGFVRSEQNIGSFVSALLWWWLSTIQKYYRSSWASLFLSSSRYRCRWSQTQRLPNVLKRNETRVLYTTVH